MLQQSGIRLEGQRHEVIHPTETIRPLRDQIVIKPLPWQPSGSIQIAGDTRRTRRTGTVVAVGPGCFPKRYNRDRSKSWDSKAFRKTEVKVGDIIEIAGPTQDEDWSLPQVLIGNELHVICREEDVCMVIG